MTKLEGLHKIFHLKAHNIKAHWKIFVIFHQIRFRNFNMINLKMTDLIMTITHYMFIAIGFSVFRFWGHLLLLTLGCKKKSATKASK